MHAINDGLSVPVASRSHPADQGPINPITPHPVKTQPKDAENAGALTWDLTRSGIVAATWP